MPDWRREATRSLKRGHKKLARTLRSLGCRGADLSTWTVKEPVYSASLARYTVSSFWQDTQGLLWAHRFDKLSLTRKKGIRVWSQVVRRNGLLYAVRIKAHKSGDCKVDMIVGAEPAPF